jgi:conjugal transfer pilus assembly protein TraB
MAEKNSALQRLLGKIPPQHRTWVLIGGLFVLAVIIIAFFDNGGTLGTPKSKEVQTANFTPPKVASVTNEDLLAKNAAQDQSITRLQGDMEKLNQENVALKQAATQQPANAAQVASQVQLDQLQAQIAELKANQALPPPVATNLPDPSVTPKAETLPVKKERRLKDFGETAPVSDNKAAGSGNVIAYLPLGSFFEVVLLNGMDAPTNAAAQKNPTPVLARVKSSAILPNRFNHNIIDCFVLVSGYGSLSSERALLRGEGISCVAADGKVFESGKTEFDGYVVGEDGRAGLRGRLVSKQGQVIARSIAAGMLTGAAQMITPTATPGLNLNSGTSYNLPPAGSVAQSMVGQGLNNAAQAVSKFYLEVAREMTPVVEIDAGRKATFILQKGLEIREKIQ